MAEQLRFDGRVALVTGAGGGLGRAYALFFGERGAKVVVNDLGGDMKGGGASSRAADVVVNEIKAKGGIAVANYDSVEDGEKVVKTALDNFGRIDIVINNAGILRDRSFARTSDMDWDLIHRVHLRGSFMVTRAAWPHMKENKFGRILMTASAAGIYGNFGQANYSAAKLGMLGLANTLAVEGRKYNINCNTLAPIAGSRLTETVMPPDLVAALKPEFVVPIVAYLSHETCEENGGLYECGAGWFGKLRWQRTKGAFIKVPPGTQLTPEEVRDKWAKITDFSDPTYPTSMQESMSSVNEAVAELEESEESSEEAASDQGEANLNRAIGAQLAEGEFSFSDRDVMLYALGVGVSLKQPDYQKFLFELSEDFSTLPTFGVIPAFACLNGLFSSKIPGLSIDPTQILHGEQYLELYGPLPTSGKLVSRGVISDVLDKGRGAILLMDIETFTEDGKKVAFNQNTIFVQGAGGFGGKRSSPKNIPTASHPDRAPDTSMQESTHVDQAAIYRLSGDRNPLHINPEFAAMGGFDTPILHGLASFGFAARHVLKQYCNNDVSKFKAIKVRFSKPVLPGQTIQTNMWKEGDRVFFECKVVESGKVCLSGAYVDLHPSAAPAVVASAGPSLASDSVFAEITKRINSNPDVVKKVNAIFQFNITQDGKVAKQWTIDAKTGGGVYQGEPKQGKAGVTLTLSDDTLVGMSSGKINGQKAFMTGKLKIKGNMMLSQKLSHLFAEQSKL